MPISIKVFAVIALVIATTGCHSRETDDCERALARLARINATRSMPPLSAQQSKHMLEVCRHGKYAAYDPALRCAMDAESDDAAAACLDELVNSVVTPGAAGGSGINPLLDPADQPTH